MWDSIEIGVGLLIFIVFVYKMTSAGTKRPEGSCATETTTSTRFWFAFKDIASVILWFFVVSIGFLVLGEIGEVMLSPFTALFRTLCS